MSSPFFSFSFSEGLVEKSPMSTAKLSEENSPKSPEDHSKGRKCQSAGKESKEKTSMLPLSAADNAQAEEGECGFYCK